MRSSDKKLFAFDNGRYVRRPSSIKSNPWNFQQNDKIGTISDGMDTSGMLRTNNISDKSVIRLKRPKNSFDWQFKKSKDAPVADPPTLSFSYDTFTNRSIKNNVYNDGIPKSGIVADLQLEQMRNDEFKNAVGQLMQDYNALPGIFAQLNNDIKSLPAGIFAAFRNNAGFRNNEATPDALSPLEINSGESTPSLRGSRELSVSDPIIDKTKSRRESFSSVVEEEKGGGYIDDKKSSITFDKSIDPKVKEIIINEQFDKLLKNRKEDIVNAIKEAQDFTDKIILEEQKEGRPIPPELLNIKDKIKMFNESKFEKNYKNKQKDPNKISETNKEALKALSALMLSGVYTGDTTQTNLSPLAIEAAPSPSVSPKTSTPPKASTPKASVSPKTSVSPKSKSKPVAPQAAVSPVKIIESNMEVEATQPLGSPTISIEYFDKIIDKLINNKSAIKKVDYEKISKITEKSIAEIKLILKEDNGNELLVKDLQLAKELIILEEENLENEEEDENKEEVSVRTISETVYNAWKRLKAIADTVKGNQLKNIRDSDTLLEIDALAKIVFPTTKEKPTLTYIKSLSIDEISNIYDKLINNQEDVNAEIDNLSGKNIKKFKQYTDKIKLTTDLATDAYNKISKLNLKGKGFTVEDTRNKWTNWAYYYVFAKTGQEPDSNMEKIINNNFNKAKESNTSNYKQTIKRGIDDKLGIKPEKKKAAAS